MSKFGRIALTVGKVIASVVLVGSVLAGTVYTVGTTQFHNKALYNTTINGVDVSKMEFNDIKNVCYTNYYKNMNFSVISDEHSPYTITSKDFDFTDSNLMSVLSQINSKDWVKSLNTKYEYTTTDGDCIDSMLFELVHTWDAMNEFKCTPSVNATVDFDDELNKFVVVPDKTGTVVDKEKFKKLITEHIKGGTGDFVLSEHDIFIPADIRADNPELNEFVANLNKYLGLIVTYDVAGNAEIFNYEDIVKYIKYDANDYTYSFDKEECIRGFISDLSSKYTTLGTNRVFTTSLGDKVQVKPGNWGWQLDIAKSNDTLTSIVDKFLDQLEITGDYGLQSEVEGELTWKTKTAVFNPNTENKDFVNYVEIDLTNQKLYLYKDGECIGNWNVVTGCVADGNKTPGGIFKLTYKTKNAVLRGPGYESPVKFWMPFNGGIGMHDASWRSKFGGTIYKYNGSHGCINMPYEGAKTVYNNIDSSYAIICYWRDDVVGE